MALRDKLRARVQPYLEPGEQVEQVFIAQTGPTPYLSVLVGVLVLMAVVKRRIVVVTDRAVLVLAAGAWTGTRPLALLARLPRSTSIGPVRGFWARMELNGERMWVHKRFHKDIEAADATAA